MFFKGEFPDRPLQRVATHSEVYGKHRLDSMLFVCLKITGSCQGSDMGGGSEEFKRSWG